MYWQDLLPAFFLFKTDDATIVLVGADFVPARNK